MSSAPTPCEIVRDARWLAQALDPASGMLRVVEMDAQSYRSASFLDDRMLQDQHFAGIVPWGSVAEAIPEDSRSDARWIFHIGHVGSTLIARLLGELDTILAVREPRILRDVAVIPPEERSKFVPAIRTLMSRTFADEQIALVKATSFVSEIAPELVPPGERALFLYAGPRAYIASILAGENSVREVSALAASRARRIAGRAELPPPNSAAQAAAAAWACEMTALEESAQAMTNRHLAWADFDEALADMPAALARVATLFGFAAPAERIEEVATGPLMSRYSKAPEHEYSPSLRRQLIAEAVAANRDDIDSALAMLQSAAATSPLLARALDRAKES